MRRLFPLFAMLLLAAPRSAGEETETVLVRLKETRSGGVVPHPAFPRVELDLVARRPDDLQGVPELSPQARYAVFKLGDRRHALAFDAPEGAFALGRLYLPGGTEALGRARPGGKNAFQIHFDGVLCGALETNVRLQYRGTGLVRAALEPVYHRRGAALLGGARRVVILVDGDCDGRYDGPADRWVALRMQKAKTVPTLRRTEALLLGEPQIPFEADGRAVMVDRVATDGSSLRLLLAKPRRPMRDVLERRYREVREEYFAKFEKERDGFEARSHLDPRRPRADAPAAWPIERLTQAQSRAHDAGRPLLIHFFSETNPWSYRFDFYTFPDREVDALLRRFVLVRIDVDKDPDRSYQELGGRGLPALVPLTPSGERVSFVLRTRDADGTIGDLGPSKEKMVTGWQRPQELIVNLKRILQAAGR